MKFYVVIFTKNTYLKKSFLVFVPQKYKREIEKSLFVKGGDKAHK